jgi:hypothetical protein
MIMMMTMMVIMMMIIVMMNLNVYKIVQEGRIAQSV